MGALVMSDVLASYRGRRVLITGHTGFKGSWLTQILVNLGAEIAGYALPPQSAGSHFELLELGSAITHVEGDIRDLTRLSRAIQDFAPDTVFHLAAQALVRQSYADPIETFSTNVMGSINLLEAIRGVPSVQSLVFVTSDKCYENHEWIWGYRENDQLGGHDPYSASKAAAEIVFSAYWRSFLKNRESFGAATTRAGNVIGGGDWAEDRIVPDCIRATIEDKPVTLRNPTATRPWQHVLEPLSGYIALGAALLSDPKRYSGAWNFGPPATQCRTVGEVADVIVRHLGSRAVEHGDCPPQYEAQLLQLNCDKAHQMLKWHPRWDVDKTLEMTAEWYRAVLGGDEAKTVTSRQICDYFPEMTCSSAR